MSENTHKMAQPSSGDAIASSKMADSAPSEETSAPAEVTYEPKPEVLHADAVDPNLVTRFERMSDRSVKRAEQRGYRVAKSKEIEAGHSGVLKPDGSIQEGDTILMVAPRAIIDGRERRRVQEMAAMDRAVNERLDAEGHLERGDSHGQTREPIRGSKGKFYSIP